jgi:hypothetical protein
MDGQAEIDRLRLEADTIMTRYQQVQRALDVARTESGDHWETGELPVTLDTPRGEEIEVTLDFDADPAGNAHARYDRADELEAQQERERRIVDQLSPLPADPVAYLVCYHLDRVKAKQAEEVRQHHTYYQLSRDGDHLLRFLGEREGRLNVLRHLPESPIDPRHPSLASHRHRESGSRSCQTSSAGSRFDGSEPRSVRMPA